MRLSYLKGVVLAAFLSANCFAAGAGASSVLDAVKSKDKEGARTLLRQGADVKTPEPDGTTALHWAAHWNDLETADLLIRAGADVRAVNRFGATPLSEAASNGNAVLIEHLLKAGADPNTLVTPQGQTVLMSAARVGNVDAVKALVEHGAYVDARENFRGQTALMWAAAEGQAPVVKMLLDHGADHRARSSDRDTTPPKLTNGTPAAPIFRGGLTALLFAVRQGQMESAKVLLDAGADINQPDSDGNNAIILALLNSHYDMTQMLIDRGADVNAANKEGRTPLFTAVDMHDEDWSPLPSRRVEDQHSALDIIRALLDKDANTNAQLTNASPIAKVAQDTGDRSLAAGGTAFMRAARSGDVAVMKLLLDHKADPKLANKNGLNALMLAAGASWAEKIKGSEAQALDAAKLCLELGLDVNAASENGSTALHGAAFRGADSIVKLLLEKGAKLDAKDKTGFNSLDIAMGKVATGAPRDPHESTIALLRQLGATPTDDKKKPEDEKKAGQ